MYVPLVLLCFALFQIIGLGDSFALNGNINVFDCKTICKVSGGIPQFDPETKSCTCLLPERADSTDVELLTKHRNLIGKKLTNIEPESPKVVVIKRELSAQEPTEELSKHEVIVGQAPEKNTFPKKPKKMRQLKTITQEQQENILKQIRNHLDKLEKAAEAVPRQREVETIQAGLRHLSYTAIGGGKSPQLRMRLHDVVEDTKNRRKEIKEKLVRLTAPHVDKHPEPLKTHLQEVPPHQIEPHFAPMTQDSKLIDA